jgi:hypothetical protein
LHSRVTIRLPVAASIVRQYFFAAASFAAGPEALDWFDGTLVTAALAAPSSGAKALAGLARPITASPKETAKDRLLIITTLPLFSRDE